MTAWRALGILRPAEKEMSESRETLQPRGYLDSDGSKEVCGGGRQELPLSTHSPQASPCTTCFYDKIRRLVGK